MIRLEVSVCRNMSPQVKRMLLAVGFCGLVVTYTPIFFINVTPWVSKCVSGHVWWVCECVYSFPREVLAERYLFTPLAELNWSSLAKNPLHERCVEHEWCQRRSSPGTHNHTLRHQRSCCLTVWFKHLHPLRSRETPWTHGCIERMWSSKSERCCIQRLRDTTERSHNSLWAESIAKTEHPC